MYRVAPNYISNLIFQLREELLPNIIQSFRKQEARLVRLFYPVFILNLTSPHNLLLYMLVK